MNEIDEKIMTYIANHGKACNKEISSDLGVDSGIIGRHIKALLNEGLIEVYEKEGRTTYYSLKTNLPSNDNVITIDMSKIKSLYQLRNEIEKILKQHNWSWGNYELAILSLLISKFTKLRLILFGSQGVGKSCCINAVYDNATENPNIVFDLHRKKLSEVVGLKESVKIIEQQYRHTWGVENPRTFDRYPIVPLSRMVPSEFIFRFMPLRIMQPGRSLPGYKPFQIKLKNFRIIEPDEKTYDEFNKAMKRLYYFNNDESECKNIIEDRKLDKIRSLYGLSEDEKQLSAKQWRIEREFDRFTKNNMKLVNLKILQEYDDLWINASTDMQLMLTSYEILKFCYSIDKDGAIRDAFMLVKDLLATWTAVQGRYVPNKKSIIPKEGVSTGYVDSAGVVHNVI
jgi:DNA-binding transcriptional ArsR family regulator